MKHKLLTVLLTLIAALCFCLGVSACDISGGSGNNSPTEQGDSSTEQGGTQKPDNDEQDSGEQDSGSEQGGEGGGSEQGGEGGGSEQGGEVGGDTHEHSFSQTWSHDETSHWHAATCGHDTERSEQAPHTYESGVCTECHYAHENHTYENGVCTVCHLAHEEHSFVYSEMNEEGHTGACSVCGKAVTGEHSYDVQYQCEECHYQHTHSYADEWESNEEGHWHTASCHPEVTSGVTEHSYANGQCTECGYKHKNHTYGDDNTCSVCGAGLYVKSENGTIYFGSYPQTEVKESGLKGFLGMEAGANPSSSNAGKWTSYDYYIDGSVRSYMWYIDVNYQGSRYRGVYFTSYRPDCTVNKPSTTDNSYQDDNGYETNTVYWFEYEPIEWRILEEKDGTALLMANIILDSQQYYHVISGTRKINSKTVYPNNYKESDIRKWLTETFYETAFDELAKQIIETTTIDNSAASTASTASSKNPYVCENTQDKVFLLSYYEATSSSYFSTIVKRRIQSTDYAKSQGVIASTDSRYLGNGGWWLRSPDSSYSDCVSIVTTDGSARPNIHAFVYDTTCGVIPALRIRL